MIRAWCARSGDVVTRTTLAALPRERARMSASDTTRDVAGSVSSLSAFVPAEATALGHRVGRATLPYVVVEHAPRGGLVVERGGFGGRPVYVRCERDVVLASTDLTWVLDAARALGVRWSSSSLDPDRLAAECILDAGAVGRTETLFRGIREVPPGMRADLVPGRMTLAALPPPRLDDAPDAHDVKRLRALLFAATERAVGGSSHVGVLTGGGLDSGALLAMAHTFARRLDAFAIDFEGPGDDRPHLVALARTVGIEPVRVKPSEALLPAALTAAGMPLTWPSAAVEATLLARARDAGASRVLAGLGADEWFDGDPDAASLLLSGAGLRSAMSTAQVFEHAGRRRALARVLWPPVRREVPWLLRRMTRRLRSRAEVPAWAGSRTKRVIAESHERALADKPWVELTAEERVLAGFRDPHLARASTLRLQLERLAGILRVDPYLDADVATFALSASPELLLGQDDPRERRGLFREALRGVLPESVRTRQDKASFAPVNRALFQPPLLATLDKAAAARVSRLADLQIVEPKAFLAAYASVVSGAGNEALVAQLYAVLAVETFLAPW